MKNKKQIRCQCPETGSVSSEAKCLYSKAEKSGMNHLPNECKGTNNIKLYKRGEKFLYLCSCCNILGDVEVE